MEYNDNLRYIANQLDKELNIMNDAVERIARERNIPKEAFITYEDIRDSVFDKFVQDYSTEILNRLYSSFKPMFDAFEKLGYKVKRDNNVVLLTNHSPAGEELNITLYLDSEDSISFQLYKLYDDFDEEDYAYALLEAKENGHSSVPSINELISDALEISKMYEQLYKTLLETRI